MPPDLPRGLCARCALVEALDLGNAPTPTSVKPEAGLLLRFSDYDLIEEIARGGMGIVYKARQISLNRIVAVKMIVSGQFASKEEVLRFRAEAESAAKLQHPNIVPIHETGEVDGQPFFSMDYVEGGDLTELVRQGPLSAHRAAAYVKKISDAIHYAHEQGILHRDLKPSNVLIDHHDELHITDFGLAKRVQKESFITITGQILGSPKFMPPEQAGGKGKAGRYSDVYGLGAILYYLVTARAPFQGETMEATLQLVLQADPVSPRLLNPELPLDLETICLKCLEKEPSRRYATAQELANELGRFVRGEPIVARPVSAGEKTWRWCQRNPQLAGAVASAVGLFLIGFTISMWQWHRAEEKADAAQINLYVADMNLAQQALRQNNRDYALEKLRGHIPKRGARSDLRGWEWRYLWGLCRPDDLSSLAVEKPVNAIAISRNGTWLAVATSDGTVQIWDYPQRRVFTNFTATPFDASQTPIAFSADGRSLAMVKDGRVYLLKAGSWELDRILVPDKPSKLFAVVFAHGSNVLATSNTGLHAWNITTDTEISTPISFTGNCQQIALSPDGNWIALSTGDRVMAWNTSAPGNFLARWLGPKQISALTISGDGWLAVCDRDGTVRLWSLPSVEQTGSQKPEREWETHSSTIYAVAFSPDDTLLATAGSDQSIHLWSTTNWENLVTLKGHHSEIWSLSFTKQGTHLISGGKDGTIREWDAQQRAISDILPGARFPLWFAADNSTIATLTLHRELQFWDVGTHALKQTFRPTTNIVAAFLEMTPDGRTVVIKTPQQMIHVVDVQSGESWGTLEIDPTGLQQATPWLCSPDSTCVAVGTERDTSRSKVSTVELFNLTTRKPVKVFDDLSWPLRFSPNGRFLAGKNSRGQPVARDIKTGRLVHVFKESREKVTSMTFSWDGQRFAASSDDHVIHLWDFASGRLLFTLKGHQEGVGKILFSRDNRTLFSTSTDDTVKMWNVATGQEMLSVTNYGGDTFELLLSPDDSTLAVGGLDFLHQPVKLWHAQTLKEIDQSIYKMAAAEDR